MKRLLAAILMLAVLAPALAACSDFGFRTTTTATEAPAATEAPTAPPAENTPEPADNASDDAVPDETAAAPEA